jgi:hypothetical protein
LALSGSLAIDVEHHLPDGAIKDRGIVVGDVLSAEIQQLSFHLNELPPGHDSLFELND